MISCSELFENKPPFLNDLNEFFKKTPCIFSSASFRNENMFFGISTNESNYLDIISQDLKNITLLFNSTEKKILSFTTYVHIFLETDVLDVTDFMIDFLFNLHGVDTVEWPDNQTNNMSEPDFKFFFAGYLWFPVLLTKDHPSAIRRFPYTMIAFQPDFVFEYNKKNNTLFYNKIRKFTHKKIDSIFGQLKPNYLTDKSSGKNIVQFIGYDKESSVSGYKFPSLCR